MVRTLRALIYDHEGTRGRVSPCWKGPVDRFWVTRELRFSSVGPEVALASSIDVVCVVRSVERIDFTALKAL